jgi:hypothetical protein
MVLWKVYAFLLLEVYKRNKRPYSVKKGMVCFCMCSVYFSTNLDVPDKILFIQYEKIFDGFYHIQYQIKDNTHNFEFLHQVSIIYQQQNNCTPVWRSYVPCITDLRGFSGFTMSINYNFSCTYLTTFIG